jgi:hypothetical protein
MQQNQFFEHDASDTPPLITQAGKSILLTTALSGKTSWCTLPSNQAGHQTCAHGYTCTHLTFVMCSKHYENMLLYIL